MIHRFKNYISQKLLHGQARTVKAKKNIAAMFVLRGISTLSNFLLVPMTLHYLNPSKYGIWLTLSSIIGWVSFLDIGLGNGLRNKIAEANAHNDDTLARTYISTTYAFVALMMLVVIALFWCINPFLRWTEILNTSSEMEQELASLTGIVFTFFCLRMVFGLVGTILIAVQRPALSSVLEVITNIFTLIVIFILTKISNGSLFWLGVSMSSVSLIVPVMANYWFFNGQYNKFAPSPKFVRLEYAKELIHLGIQFFILQIAGLFIFSSSNIVITQLFGPTEVTPFNIAFKYYGIASMAFMILLTPFWSASTESFVKGDTAWIIRAIKKLVKYWLALVFVVLVMTVFADQAYNIWVGAGIQVPHALSIFMGLYVLIFAWSNIFVYFISATGKIRLQLWAAAIVAVAIIPVSILLASNLGLKSTGVVMATCVCLLPPCFLWPIQVRKLLTGRATGIWNR